MNVSAVHQDRDHRDSAATVAAGIATAFAPGSSLDDVRRTMESVAHDTVARAFDLTLDHARRSDSIDVFVEAYYDEMLDWKWPAVRWDKERYRTGRLFSDTEQ